MTGPSSLGSPVNSRQILFFLLFSAAGHWTKYVLVLTCEKDWEIVTLIYKLFPISCCSENKWKRCWQALFGHRNDIWGWLQFPIMSLLAATISQFDASFETPLSQRQFIRYAVRNECWNCAFGGGGEERGNELEEGRGHWHWKFRHQEEIVALFLFPKFWILQSQSFSLLQKSISGLRSLDAFFCMRKITWQHFGEFWRIHGDIANRLHISHLFQVYIAVGPISSYHS